MTNWKFLAIAVIVVVAGFFLVPALYPLATVSELTDDGEGATQVRHDRQGNLSDYYPSSKYCNLPSSIVLNGVRGEAGHISYGKLRMADSDERYSTVGFKVTLDQADFAYDEDTTRIGLATMWKPTDPNSDICRYYVEFDIFTGPAREMIAEAARYNYWNPSDIDGPTIEYKLDQLKVGETAEYKIDIEQAFELAYPGVDVGDDVTLDGVYLVVLKSSLNSEFTIGVTLDELWLYE